MVKVAIDVGPLHGHRTGVGNAVAWTLEALDDLVTHGPSAPDVEFVRYLTSMRARVSAPDRRLPIPAALAVRLWAHRAPRVDRWLRSPDLVHGTNYVVPPTSCPQLVSVYDCWFLDNPDSAEPDVRRAGKVLHRAADNGAHIVASSRATAERVRDLLSTDRVRTIHLGPPPPSATVPPDRPAMLPDLDGDPFLLALGTLERRKNIPTLVTAFGKVAHDHETVRLVIAGASGNDVAAADRAIAALAPDAARRVVRLGTVDQPMKAWLLANARALAYPSLDEGFGFPILEAQQAGTPVVASTAGSIPEIAGPAALLSPPTDVEALAANLYWILTSDDMHTKLARRGKLNLSRFSWGETATQLTETYAELVGS